MKEFLNWLEVRDFKFYDTITEGKKKKKWIQKIDVKKGAFTDYCGGEVTNDCIERGMKSDDPHVVRMANLARTFRKISKNKKK